MMNIRNILLASTFLLLSVLFCSCSGNGLVISSDMMIDRQQSVLSRVETDEEYVFYYVDLTINSNAEIAKPVKLIGHFPDEFKAGILQAETAIGTYKQTETLIIEKGENRMEGVVFQVPKNKEYEGSVLKRDRLLPKIEIVPAE